MNKPKRSRQERALAQRGDEFKVWTDGGDRAEKMTGRCRRKTGYDDKASKASRDVTALKAKLGKVDA